MRRFSGRVAHLYAIGDPFGFSSFLEDCGDGWDWRSPQGLGFWSAEHPLVFEVMDGLGDWREAGAVEVFPRSGRVGLDRCVPGPVRASGTGRTTSHLCAGERWELVIESHAGAEDTMAGSYAFARMGSAAVTVTGCPEVPIEEVAVLLPHGVGAFVGVGSVRQQGGVATVRFNEEGVEYERR